MLESFGTAFGAQVRSLRESAGLTQDEVSRAISRAGLPWTRARYGQVEAGEMGPDLAAMCAIAIALQELSGSTITLPDLLPEDAGDEVSRLRDALSGKPVRASQPSSDAAEPRLSPGWGQVEDRVVADIGAGSEAAVLSAAIALFGRTGSEERDARAGEGATPQKRGRAARAVIAELTHAATNIR